MALNLAQIIDTGELAFPDAIAMIHPEVRLTYREVAEHVRRFAGALAVELATSEWRNVPNLLLHHWFRLRYVPCRTP